MQYYKDLIYNFFNLFGVYEIALMGFLFIIFLIFFLLGLLLAGRKVFPQLMFFFATAIFIFAPIALQMVMQRFLYTTEVNITESKRLAYIDAFFLQGRITNVGFSPFSVCEASVSVLREGILEFLNPIFPLERYSKTINMPLKPKESGEFSVVFDEFSTQLPFKYRIDIDCHNISGLIKFGLQENSHTDEVSTEELPKHQSNDKQELGEDSDKKQSQDEQIQQNSNRDNEPSDEVIDDKDNTQLRDLPTQNQTPNTPQDNLNQDTHSQSESKGNDLQNDINKATNPNDDKTSDETNAPINQNATQQN